MQVSTRFSLVEKFDDIPADAYPKVNRSQEIWSTINAVIASIVTFYKTLPFFQWNIIHIEVLRGSDLFDDAIAEFEHEELKREQQARELQNQKEEEERLARELREKQENEAKLNQNLKLALEKLQKKKDQQVFEDRLKSALEQRKMKERQRQEEKLRRIQEKEEERQWHEQQMLAYNGQFFQVSSHLVIAASLLNWTRKLAHLLTP